MSAAAGSLDIQSDGVGYRKVHAESTDNGIVSFRKVGTPVPGSTLVDFQVSLDAEISMQDIFEGDTPVDLWREERELDGLGINLRLNLKKEAGGFGSRFDGAKMRNLALNMANSAEGMSCWISQVFRSLAYLSQMSSLANYSKRLDLRPLYPSSAY